MIAVIVMFVCVRHSLVYYYSTKGVKAIKIVHYLDRSINIVLKELKPLILFIACLGLVLRELNPLILLIASLDLLIYIIEGVELVNLIHRINGFINTE